MNLVDKLPAIPGNAEQFIIFYYEDNYCCVSSYSFKSNSERFSFGPTNFYVLSADGTQWKHGDNPFGTFSCSYDDLNNYAVLSNFDIRDNNGNIILFGSDYQVNSEVGIIASSVTPSTLKSVFKDFSLILPLLTVTVVFVIAFRKVWSFVRLSVKGA